jgi:hypothetical protein
MKIDRKKFFLPYKPAACLSSSIGRLAVFGISSGDQGKLLATLGTTLASCTPARFMKEIVPYICYPIDRLDADQGKPSLAMLSGEDVAKLTEADIEKIAGVYIDTQPYLYRKDVRKAKTDKDGKEAVSLECGDVEYPKEASESNAQYLQRLYAVQETKQKEWMDRLTGPFLGKAHFSPKSYTDISKTLAMGDSLAKALDAAQGASDKYDHLFEKQRMMMDELRPPEFRLDSTKNDGILDARPVDLNPRSPAVDLAAIGRDAAKAHWAPFKFLGERLDSIGERLGNLVAISSDSGKFLVKMNETQTAIASEIKASGEDASRLSRKNLTLTIVVVVLTVTGLVMSPVIAWIDHRQRNADAEALRTYASGIKSELTSVSTALSDSTKSADDRTSALLAEMERTRASEESRVNNVLNRDLESLEQLEQRQAADQLTIEELRSRVSELESQLKSPSRVVPATADK